MSQPTRSCSTCARSTFSLEGSVRITGQSVEMVWVTPNPEKAIEAAGRTCYQSQHNIGPGTAPVFVRMLLSHDPPHEAMIEHASACLRFVTDRGISHELVRHRLCSFAQVSTRYCNYAKDKFGNEIAVVPMLDDLTDAQVQRRRDLYANAEQVYLAEVAEGVRPQQARDNLPTCLQTEIVVTANLRQWRHILRLRLDKRAHPQMRRLMAEAWRILYIAAPSVFEDFTAQAKEVLL